MDKTDNKSDSDFSVKPIVFELVATAVGNEEVHGNFSFVCFHLLLWTYLHGLSLELLLFVLY